MTRMAGGRRVFIHGLKTHIAQVLRQRASSPDDEDHRVDQQFENREVMTPPIIGAAMRFITSAPACVVGDHMIGSRPKRIAQTVMILGGCAAPRLR